MGIMNRKQQEAILDDRGISYNYKDKEAVLILFTLPINVDQDGAKTVSDRVMEVVNLLEQAFISLEYLNSEEVETDRHVYVTAIKTIE